MGHIEYLVVWMYIVTYMVITGIYISSIMYYMSSNIQI